MYTANLQMSPPKKYVRLYQDAYGDDQIHDEIQNSNRAKRCNEYEERAKTNQDDTLVSCRLDVVSKKVERLGLLLLLLFLVVLVDDIIRLN